MTILRFTRWVALLCMLAIGAPLAQAQAQSTAAPINANLKEAFYHLPIPGIEKAMDGLFNALKKGESGGYAAKTTVSMPGVGSVPLQLYFFGKDEKQVLMLVVNSSLTMPKVFNNRTWQKLADSKLSDPIFTVSTTDFALTTHEMPADFQKIVADSYFNVAALNFTSGFQVAARIQLGGVMKSALEKTMGTTVHDFTMRAGVVIPVPSNATQATQLAAQLAADMKKVGQVLKDQPNFFVELQPAPGTKFTAPMHMSSLVLTDATFSLDWEMFLGFKGNIVLPSGKKFITYFDTPLPIPDPVGLEELSSFDFGFTSQSVTYKDIEELSIAMSTPQMKGGSLIKGLDKYRDKLQSLANALTVFELANPNTVGDYVFGDPNKPFPNKGAFMLAVGGPTASISDSNGRSISGPYLVAQGNLKVLGQKVGTAKLTVGDSGFHSIATAGLTLKMGPLGKTGINMTSSADIDASQQKLLVHGNALGRALDASLDSTNLSVNSPATCATPFSLSETIAIQPTLDLSSLMDALPGVNVDPAKVTGCLGDDLKKAYQWVSTTGGALGGYTAQMASADLKKVTDAEAAAAKAAQDAYNQAKDQARNAANNAKNSAMDAFRGADNAFKKLGFKKKKHHKGPDPKFAESVFDWDYYYDNAPDVVKAGVDLATHWQDHGFLEGRQGADTFSAKFYLNRYGDVQQKCGGDLQCALQHWLDEGIEEGRQGSAQFNVTDYISRYPDLQQAFGREGYADAIDHWINHGQDEGRNGRPNSTATGPVSGPKLEGGDGGTPWTDRDVACGSGDYVTGFRLLTGKYVDSVQFQYNYSKWGPVHGAQGKQPNVEFLLRPGEYVVRVDTRSGSLIDAIGFVTNQDRGLGMFGGGGGTYNAYPVTPGEKVGCMRGRSGSSVDQLIFSSTGLR